MKQVTIEQVKKYWNENPLLSIELEENIGSKEYIIKHEKIVGEIIKYSHHIWEFDKKENMKVLDIGCGTGYLVRSYARNGADITGVDLTEKGVEITNNSLNMFNLKGKAIVGNAEELPFEDNSFDFISCAGVIHHTPNIEMAIHEIHRVLKPGCNGVVSVYHKNIFMNKLIWPITRIFVKLLFGHVKGRNFRNIKTVDDLVRVYDGDNNPLGKAYSKKDMVKLFNNFSNIEDIGLNYFPFRFFKNKKLLGFIDRIHRFLDRTFGLMIWIKVKK